MVGGGYLHALKLVSLVCVPWFVFALCFAGNFFRPRKSRACWFVPCWFVSWLVWLPACLETRALLVGVPLVNNAPCAWWLPACLGACALVVRVLGRFVGGYLCTLELVPWFVFAISFQEEKRTLFIIY